MIKPNVKQLALAAPAALVFLSAWYPSVSKGTGLPRGQAAGAPDVSYDDTQGWNPDTRYKYHYTSQGSELIPYFWFLALSEPGSPILMKDDLEKYGFLYEPVPSAWASLNPDHLPIGFSKHDEGSTPINKLTEEHWLGFTCAACHSGAINYKKDPNSFQETTLIIDGAPTSADLGRFFVDLAAAVSATNNDPQQLGAFVDRVVQLEPEVPATDVQSRFKTFAAQFQSIVKYATPSRPWGPGRVDAFGVIFNRVCNYDVLNSTSGFQTPDAPVSFPFLWYTNRQDNVQWSGTVSNKTWVNRLGRNVGEVLGVFARVDVRPTGLVYKYPSSVDVKGLGALDSYIETLKAPTWPKQIFGYDSAKAGLGKQLFQANCSTQGHLQCHADVADLGKLVEIKPIPLSEVNTDDATTRLVNSRKSPTGILAGKRKLCIPLVGGAFPKNGSDVPANELLGNIGAGSLIPNLRPAWDAYIEYLRTSGKYKAELAAAGKTTTLRDRTTKAHSEVTPTTLAGAYSVTSPQYPNANPTDKDIRDTIGYEARPLAGIWATAPYLHNGSIPNLVQLLWPEKRAAKFYVGSLEYDSKRIGYVSDGTKGGVPFDTTLPGNSNSGHEYGAPLSDTEKWEIIEYLKSL